MPWEKVCTFVPCCEHMKSLLKEGMPYYKYRVEKDGINLIRYSDGGCYLTIKYCPYCGKSTLRGNDES